MRNNRISQSVPHLHVHVVPRRHEDGLKGFFWPRQPYRDDAEIGEVQARLGAAVAEVLRSTPGPYLPPARKPANRRPGFRVAAEGRDPQRQDGADGIRPDAGRDRPGDPRGQAPLSAQRDLREPLSATAATRGRSAGQEDARGRLPEGPAGEDGAGPDQPRAEAAQDPDRRLGRAEVNANGRLREVTDSLARAITEGDG
jgi:hypothetical protein